MIRRPFRFSRVSETEGLARLVDDLEDRDAVIERKVGALQFAGGNAARHLRHLELEPVRHLAVEGLRRPVTPIQAKRRRTEERTAEGQPALRS